MNMFRKLFLISAALLALAFSSNAAAADLKCSSKFIMGVNLPPVIEINPNAATEEVLWSAIIVPTVIQPGNCSGEDAINMIFTGSGMANTPQAYYETGIPGINYRVKTLSGNCSQQYWLSYCSDKFNPINPDVKLQFELVKGMVNAQEGILGCCSELGKWKLGTDDSHIYISFIYAGQTAIKWRKPPTCSFPSKASIQASLGVVSTSHFKGVGSTSPERPFSIDLSCKGGNDVSALDVYVTLTDATKPGNRSKVLTLSPQSGAKGVGIEVLSGTMVVGYGAASSALGNPGQWKAGTVSPGTTVFSIPLAARYVQTESVVTPGSANGRATFTMSYQ